MQNPKRWCCWSAALNMPVNLENSTVATWPDWDFIPIPKEGNAKECSNYHKSALISHASKVMLKILQARLQLYMNQELPDVQARFRKGRGTRDQIANTHWIKKKKSRGFQKNIYFCFTDYAKSSFCYSHIVELIPSGVHSPRLVSCPVRMPSLAFPLCSSYFFLSISQATNLLIQFIFSISSLANSTFLSAKKPFPAIPKSPLVGSTVSPKFMPSQNLRMWPDWEIRSLQI